jgi:hypothetical protein
MNEAEWFRCMDPYAMLAFLRNRGKDRSLRLFACACLRRVWHLITEGGSAPPLAVAEWFAEGLASRDGLLVACCGPSPGALATLVDAGDAARNCAWFASCTARKAGGLDFEGAYQCCLLRDIIGNPFRKTTLSPSWLDWNDRTVPRMAQALYDGRRFDEVPVLGDALEEAGCDDEDLLAHCRAAGAHVLGCWVVDLVLGKG